MAYSKFAEKLGSDVGIVALMQDLSEALNLNPDILFLGGGNPASIPAFESIIASELSDIAANPKRLRKLIGVYQSPQGDDEFIDALLAFYRDQMAWPITRGNIAIANGSQAAFFILLNMLAGDCAAGKRKICFPLMPEYLGYADQSISVDSYYGVQPEVEQLAERLFKYRVNFNKLKLTPDTAAICVSRPSNPSGNVLSADEVDKLLQLSQQKSIPLIVDCAYGNPFPGVCYEQVESFWQPGMVLVQSLSKLGLPGARTGIVIADEALIQRFVKINTVLSLANANLGPALAVSLLTSGRISTIRDQILLPYYQQKRDFMLACIGKYFQGIRYLTHKAEGGFFIWLWLPELPISSKELYLRCKQQGLLIMPGEPFFFGLPAAWRHSAECVRLNYCASNAVIEEGIKTLAAQLQAL